MFCWVIFQLLKHVKLLRKIIIIFFLLILFQPVFSQADDNIRFSGRVKQLEDFYNRFNFRTDILGKIISDINNVIVEINSSKINFSKNQLIRFLLNSEKKLTVIDSMFIKTVCENNKPIVLGFYDDNWYALAQCNITFTNKQETLNLTLRNEVYPGHKSKWVIAGADAGFLNLLQKPKDTLSIISPISNDLNFLELSKAFNQPENLSQFFDKTIDLQEIPVLASLITSKQIKFNGVKRIVYHFLQIDGWIFTVEFFNREQGNSGWLISDIIKCNNEEKLKYKREKLHLMN